MADKKKVLHSKGPHNINGWGTITKCPEECPAHERWLKEQENKDV